MGSGIAQVCAQAGFTTVVREVSPEIVDKGFKGIEKNLARLVEKGALTEAQKTDIRGRMTGTTALEDLKDCDLVVEAIIEQLPAKRELFAKLDVSALGNFRQQYFLPDHNGNLHGHQAPGAVCGLALF
jgi:3-hydroxybutyryl-CoA dehydrogenase